MPLPGLAKVGHRCSSGRSRRVAGLIVVSIASLLAVLPADGATVGSDSTWIDSFLGGSFNAVSCATSSFCVAVSTTTASDDAVVFDGRTWSNATLVAKYEGELVGLSCPSLGTCVALTDLGDATVLNHGHWSRLVPVDPQAGAPYPGIVASLSCTSASLCVAVDGAGNATTYDGTSWSKPILIDSDDPLDGVSCLISNFCVAVDGAGRVLVQRHGRWSSPEVIDADALTAVSCATSSFCVAVDIDGRALRYDGSRWSGPEAVATLTANPLALSCPSVGRCVLVDAADELRVLHGDAWSTPKVIVQDGGGLISVSCPSRSNFCATVDSFGGALVDQAVLGGS